MNDLQTLKKFVTTNFPNLEVTLQEPKHKDGFWSLDLRPGNTHITIEWSSDTGFAIGYVTPDTFGERPDEAFRDIESAKRRLTELLNGDKKTSPPYAMSLSGLRDRRGVTQRDLSLRMGVKQSSISGFERRDDIQIGTLCRYIAALEGSVQICAIFSDAWYFVEVPGGPLDHPPAALSYRKLPAADTSIHSVDVREAFHALGEAKVLPRAESLATRIKERGSVLEFVE